MNAYSTHPSVRLKGSEDNYEPVLCAIPDCPKRLPHLHCPFCVKTDVFHDPVILKAHYRVKHVDKGIDFSGLKVLRCCDNCEIVGTIKGQKAFKGAHWHCYKCRNGFNRRDEALKHYKTHFRNPMTTFQIQVQQDINQMMYVPMHTETVECPGTQMGTLSEDGTFFMPSNWTAQTDQILMHNHTADGIGLGGSVGSHVYNHTQDQLHQVSIAANETIGGGADDNQGYYVMEHGQGDFVQCPDSSISATMQTKTTEQWVKELETTNDQSNRRHSFNGNMLGSKSYDHTSNQPKDNTITNLKQEVNDLKSQLSAKDERILQLEKREKDLISQLRTVEGLPVSEILGDLKEKQEQLFLQYLSKLKTGTSAATEPKPASADPPAVIENEKKNVEESPQNSQSDSQFSQSSRTLSTTSCQSDVSLPAHMEEPLSPSQSDTEVPPSPSNSKMLLVGSGAKTVRSEAVQQGSNAQQTENVQAVSNLIALSTDSNTLNPNPTQANQMVTQANQMVTQANQMVTQSNSTISTGSPQISVCSMPFKLSSPTSATCHSAISAISPKTTAFPISKKIIISPLKQVYQHNTSLSPRPKQIRIVYASPSPLAGRKVFYSVQGAKHSTEVVHSLKQSSQSGYQDKLDINPDIIAQTLEANSSGELAVEDVVKSFGAQQGTEDDYVTSASNVHASQNITHNTSISDGTYVNNTATSEEGTDTQELPILLDTSQFCTVSLPTESVHDTAFNAMTSQLISLENEPIKFLETGRLESNIILLNDTSGVIEGAATARHDELESSGIKTPSNVPNKTLVSLPATSSVATRSKRKASTSPQSLQVLSPAQQKRHRKG